MTPVSRPHRAVVGLTLVAALGTLAAARADGAGSADPARAAAIGDAATSPAGSDVGGDTTEFRHGDHRGVSCVTCHPSEESHGGLAVTQREDCLQCHHRAAEAPACSRCHASADLRGTRYRVRRSLELSVGPVRERSLSFDHGEHGGAACEDCHTGGAELSAGSVSCADCHAEHHRPDSDCMACHADPPGDAHTVEVAHVTCGGSGCHRSLPFPRVPRSRPACLSCHRDLVDHRPGQPCVQCHVLPDREPQARDGATGAASR